MDTFPDLGSLSDQELKDLIQQLTEEEVDISYKRRILHGKIDILRAELVNRLRKKHEGGEDVITGDDVQRLTDILAGRAAGRRRPRSSRVAGADPMALHCPECGFVNAEGANYCQSAARSSAPGRAKARRGARRPRPTASTRPASSCPVDVDDVVADEGAALVIRAGGGRVGESFPLDARPHDDRPAARTPTSSSTT